MGKIKKITENELVGGIQGTDIYPVTSVKAVYDENNERLDNIINKLDNTINKIEPGIIYDVSANNDGAVFESLQALLSSSSLNTLIPTSVRCGGMSIRFIQDSVPNSDNKYVQYRLTASIWSTDIHDWTSEDPYFIDKIMQEVNEAIDEHTPIEIHGDVTNAPDEEDLTSANVGGTDVLKFKDKTYNPLNYSGMGRKILRKNIVNGVNTLTQTMINKSNTIYVIQYDFTLGEDITVPANCVLEFEGGSISGAYTLTGTNTGIQAGLVKIFNTDVTFAGTWNVDSLHIKWFGAKGDGVTDDTAAFKNCIESPAVAVGGYKILINRGKYCINDTIYIPKRSTTICGESRNILYFDEAYSSCIIFKATNKELFRILGQVRGVTFENLNFDCYRHTNNNWYQGTTAIKFQPESTDISGSVNHVIRNCNFLGFAHDIYVSGIQENIDWQCDHIIVENCNFTYYSENGIYINSRNAFDFSTIRNCGFGGCPMNDNIPAKGIDVDRSGFFEIVQCAGSSMRHNVTKSSDADKYTTFAHIKGYIGIITFNGIQAEAIENTIIFETLARYNVSVINSTIDSKIYIKKPLYLTLNNNAYNDNILFAGNVNDCKVVSDKTLRQDKIQCEGNSYNNSIITMGDIALNLRDIAYLGNGVTISDIINPKRYSDIITADNTTIIKEFPLIGTIQFNPNCVAYNIVANCVVSGFTTGSSIVFYEEYFGGAVRKKISEISESDLVNNNRFVKTMQAIVDTPSGSKLKIEFTNVYVELNLKIESLA